VTQQVAADASGRWRRELVSVIRHGRIGRQVAGTAGYNVAAAAAAGLGGIIIARTLGPDLRGEYAAVTAWFGVTLIIGDMGQPAALCYYVAHDPANARGYVATSRAMMVATGTIALVGGILLAPHLARGHPGLTEAYRIAFSISIVAYVGASYTFSLQAVNLNWWNTVRISQPALSLAAIVALWRLRMLTLNTALVVLALTMLVQLGWAYYRCRSAGLVPGRAQARHVRPLAGYGAAQIAALTPATLNAQLDQLVLSQVVAPAVLGRYAIAVSCTLIPIPLVSAVGNVAFPRLASRYGVDRMTRRMQWAGIAGSACVATVMLAALALAAPWLIPHVFGPRYAAAVPLLWILAPSGVFMACNQVTADVLRGRKHPLAVARAQGLAAVFTVALLATLVPLVGVYGAAIASTVAYGVALVMMLLSLRRLESNGTGRRRRKRRAHGVPAHAG
jgi:O-antigen/teichoic acid export membrane protein